MRITYKGDYALKALLDLALHYEQGLSTINDIAGHIDAPVKFLEQVLLDLKKSGFVESKRGNVGGYRLAKDPSDITLGEVIRRIDGPIEPIACVEKNYSDCVDLQRCVFKGIWKKISFAVSGIVDNISFADLVKQVKSERQALVYAI
ncbi:MAG: Rrf2 family transcriptional regulator [Candidatus Omnitrophica bacterium]|jgi:Rrf2 family protein|nr:Rrf2 family transcriptional regulator [Candidatus Omnitrophota bacterium]MDD3275253.1 Rrf2 family transcriptional regulator [Candidatus Omnitrophota bacterium]MDD5077412.1 Rrf2 family transcriptional regulator [Candidatus Omnitrophota bacterium]MDD5725180.1 Rrf2 family transcriptional regulator [Candidatus Omnitrophota bacterium]